MRASTLLALAAGLAGLAAGSPAIASPDPATAQAQAPAPDLPPDLRAFQLNERAPALYAALTAALPPAAPDERWLRELKGVSGPLAPVEVAGKGYLSGYVCKPQDCRANRLVFLIAPDGSRAATEVRFGDGAARREALGGESTPEERAWLQDRLDD